jgi:uncharacterized protein (DUF3084 family)
VSGSTSWTPTRSQMVQMSNAKAERARWQGVLEEAKEIFEGSKALEWVEDVMRVDNRRADRAGEVSEKNKAEAAEDLVGARLEGGLLALGRAAGLMTAFAIKLEADLKQVKALKKQAVNDHHVHSSRLEKLEKDAEKRKAWYQSVLAVQADTDKSLDALEEKINDYKLRIGRIEKDPGHYQNIDTRLRVLEQDLEGRVEKLEANGQMVMERGPCVQPPNLDEK